MKKPLNYCYGVTVNFKAFYDFIEYKNTEDKNINSYNSNHLIIISYLVKLWNDPGIIKYTDQFNIKFIKVTKGFIKTNLIFLNISTNTETKIFTDLENLGMIRKYLKNKNERYIHIESEFIKFLNQEYLFNPIKKLQSIKSYWIIIKKDFGKEKDFQKWCILFDAKYKIEGILKTTNELKSHFYDHLTVCKERASQNL